MRRLPPLRSRQRGLSLVELMISVVLGLFVVGSAIAVFLSNRQTYTATENLGRIQETGRVAFELMARDLREAGGTPCERDLLVFNALGSTDWWNTWGAPVTGVEAGTDLPSAAGEVIGTDPLQRVDETDALQLRAAISNGTSVIDHEPQSGARTMQLTSDEHGLGVNDIFMVCNFEQAAISRVTAVAADTITHSDNCLSPAACDDSVAVEAPNPGDARTYSFNCFRGMRLLAGGCAMLPDGTTPSWPALVAELRAWRWYVGNNGRTVGTGRSLFRTGITDGGVLTTSEIAEDVIDMQLAYLEEDDDQYTDATGVGDWDNVVAVRITLTISGSDAIGTDGERVDREVEHIVALRNRVS